MGSLSVELNATPELHHAPFADGLALLTRSSDMVAARATVQSALWWVGHWTLECFVEMSTRPPRKEQKLRSTHSLVRDTAASGNAPSPARTWKWIATPASSAWTSSQRRALVDTLQESSKRPRLDLPG